ncbi:MAG: hypothetical protein ACYDDU_03805 [Dermatophilaceae bacterium]
MRSPVGPGAVYDDGHLIELAVFECASLPSLSVNDYRVLVDRSDLTARLATLKRDTTLRVVDAMLSLLEEHLVDRVPALSAESLTAVRAVAARLQLRRRPSGRR